ncbi:putative ibr domain-containing protein [Seiridium cardinale]|uniref:RBR-type E3 ubiquitin transferase n=1 Tax=Seiridium cardinale TaxID=138064 RepID=A0ABR2X808_9PEZI
MGSSSSKNNLKQGDRSIYSPVNPAILEDLETPGFSPRIPRAQYNDHVFGQRYYRASEYGDTIVTNQRVPRLWMDNDLQDCNVCAETKPTRAFPILSVSSQCAHPPRTCLDCVATSIKTDFATRRWNQIHCPDCRALMGYEDVERYADEETFSKYQNLAFRGAVNEAPDFVWCPADCGSGQIHEAGNAGPIVRCARCGFKFCFNHQQAWHQELTCEEYDELLSDPRGFRSRIEIANEEAENERLAEQRLKQEQEDADRKYAQSLADADEAARAERQVAQERRQREIREAEDSVRREKERRASQQNVEKMRREAAKRKREETQMII